MKDWDAILTNWESQLARAEEELELDDPSFDGLFDKAFTVEEGAGPLPAEFADRARALHQRTASLEQRFALRAAEMLQEIAALSTHRNSQRAENRFGAKAKPSFIDSKA